MKAIQNVHVARFPVLTPNIKVNIWWILIIINEILVFLLVDLIPFGIFYQGFEAAVAAGAKEVAVFASASESFSMSNINCSIADSLARYQDVALAAKNLAIPIRGYVWSLVVSFLSLISDIFFLQPFLDDFLIKTQPLSIVHQCSLLECLHATCAAINDWLLALSSLIDDFPVLAVSDERTILIAD